MFGIIGAGDEERPSWRVRAPSSRLSYPVKEKQIILACNIAFLLSLLYNLQLK